MKKSILMFLAVALCSMFGLAQAAPYAGAAIGNVTGDSGAYGKVFAGYGLGSHFAVEAAYSHFSHAKDTVEAVGIAKYALTPFTNLYAKVGEHATHSNGATHTGVTYGAGVEQDLSKNLFARVEYQRYQKIDGVRNAGATTLGVGYRF